MKIILKKYSTIRISEVYGPLKILASAESLLAKSLRFAHIFLITVNLITGVNKVHGSYGKW